MANDLTPIVSIEYWADAYSGDGMGGGHGMIVNLLREYAAMRRAQPAAATAPGHEELPPGIAAAAYRLREAGRRADEKRRAAAAAPPNGIAEIEAMLMLCEAREWAETLPKTAIGQRLEAVLMDLHNELHDAGDENAAPAVQAVPAVPLLAKDHQGMRVDYSGLLKHVHGALRCGIKEPALVEMLRQFQDHLAELGRRWYAGDTAVVDEILQLYCIEGEARAALTTQGGSHAV